MRPGIFKLVGGPRISIDVRGTQIVETSDGNALFFVSEEAPPKDHWKLNMTFEEAAAEHKAAMEDQEAVTCT